MAILIFFDKNIKGGIFLNKANPCSTTTRHPIELLSYTVVQTL